MKATPTKRAEPSMLARSIPSPFRPPPLLRPNPDLRRDLLLLPRSRRRLRPPGVRALSDLGDLLRSPAALSLLAPALAAVSASALLHSPRHRPRCVDPKAQDEAVAGDWILFTSPTPFNRCVLLRCPSVSFEDGGEILRRDRCYVNLSRGSIPVAPGKNSTDAEDGPEGVISYQRICVGTEDGGVISLDFPAELEMDKEHGLDTTVLLVPGTAEGSMDRSVKLFVRDALDHGYFPVVMNPRGCAGSPLTTARLFTAADSDDVSTAIQFINRLRPWTTLMSVAWGYGANMLTKYLAEVGETTPLTATVCIDNPFDLDEATRSFPHHIAMDQKLTSGLVDILRANKELFQGKAKGFDVGKALSATSIRDFDGAVSMISYGFDAIEDFYSYSGTRGSVSNVKIPVLYIQSDDGTVPLFSIPRSSISENPFTSLLLCSCLPSTTTTSERSAVLWCQHLAIEWLSAVEFALLKGRHPLLQDVDITINPSAGLSFVEGRELTKSILSENESGRSYDPARVFLSRKNANGDNYLKLSQSNLVNGFLTNPKTSVSKENDVAAHSKASIHSELGNELRQGRRGVVETQQESSSNISEQNDIVKDIATREEDSEIDSEQSQVLQTAAVVMNMLDVTIPGTLDDGQKKKVLTAMEQGETFMKALDGAVPEDVRGKLTTAVTEILHTQSTNLNLDGLRRIGWIPNVSSNVRSGIKKLRNNNESDQRQSDVGNEGRPQDDSAHSNAGSNNTRESTGSSQQKVTKSSECLEADSEVDGKSNQPKQLEKATGGNDGVVGEQLSVNQSHGVADRHSMDDQVTENDTGNNETKSRDFEAEHVPILHSNSERTFAAGSSSSDQTVEKGENKTPKDEDKISQDAVNQKAQASSTKSEDPSSPPPKAPSISVTEALDALTGLDDSTQMAVNSVFGVLENMIDQLERTSNQEKDDGGDKAEDQEPDIESDDSPSSQYKTDSRSGVSLGSGVTQSSNQGGNSFHEGDVEYHEEVNENSGSVISDGFTSSEKTGINCCQDEKAEIDHLSKVYINGFGYVQNFPVGVAMNPYLESPYRRYLQRCFTAQLPIMKSIDSDSTTDLILDPEEGQWRMLDQTGNTEDIIGENEESQNLNGENINFSLRGSDKETIVEPSYVILDTEYSRPGYSRAEEHEEEGDSNEIKDTEKELIYLIRNSILKTLKVEVGRRLGMFNLKEAESNLVYDLEQVADSVSWAIVCDSELILNSFNEAKNSVSVKLGTVEAERIIKAIYSAVQEAHSLRKILPVGVIVGSSLASLRKYFQVSALHDDDQNKAVLYNPGDKPEEFKSQQCDIKDKLYDEKDRCDDSDKSFGGDDEKPETADSNKDGIMVGAVTAALGASALLAHHQQQKINKFDETPFDQSNAKAFPHGEHVKIEEAMEEKNQSLVSSLAEKAMSVAGPVVPTKSDGEVDHERLVAILAELGQKGGMLRLIGKIALLWGGIRGAISLTDRLISFLHIAERPLFQRLLGFVCMVLVLWSPVAIPFLPTLVQSWTTKTSNGIAEYSCIVGLYVAIMILVILWGKRIRGYDDPLEQYGLHLTSVPRVHHFLKGLLGGVMIVLFIHSINALLGYASLSWPLGLPSSSGGTMMLLKAYGSMLLLAVRGVITAIGIAFVEELLFRSWFLEEVAVDFGYYRAVVISGLAFSLAQRSLNSVPGFLLLSLALCGIKQRAHGKLYAPIGVRTGIMTANFVIQNSNFLKYQPSTPFWLSSTHAWHPFDGVVGLSICGILAILFFPKQPLPKKVSEEYSGAE